MTLICQVIFTKNNINLKNFTSYGNIRTSNISCYGMSNTINDISLAIGREVSSFRNMDLVTTNRLTLIWVDLCLET